MERRTLVLVVATYILMLTARSESTVEQSGHWCGRLKGNSWAECDPGRCCSFHGFCGDTAEYCAHGACWFNCDHAPTPAAYDQTNYEAADQTGGITAVNATPNYYNNHYMNNVDELVKVAPANASSFSSSSALSCAASLSRLPLASRRKYPFAALTAPLPQNNVTASTRCGRCLKVTNLGVGGLSKQVKVRIAHEHNKQGLELDFNTFKKLGINSSTGIAEGHFLVKYRFESC